MKRTLVSLAYLMLAGCGGGGGGGGGTSSPLPPMFVPVSMQGTAATGMPIANATVNVLCGSGEKKTTTTGSDGSYSVDISGCTGPFVVTVSGTMGDTQDALVSVNPNDPPPPVACSVTPLGVACPLIHLVLVTNITPITHAIAALVASTGDPFDLVRNFAMEKSRITASAVSNATTAMTNVLANVMTAAGVSAMPPGGGPIGAFMRADGTGWDKVLDNVKFEVSPTGITLTSISAAKVDDMAAIANGTAAPPMPPNSQIVLNKNNFEAPPAPGTTTPIVGSVDDQREIDSARDAANACFAVSAGQRGTFANPGAACANLATSDYLNDGKNGSTEFDRFLTDPRMDGAKFNKPAVLSYFTSERALVILSAMRTDGLVISWRTVVENSAATGNIWKLRGNQRPYFMFVNGVVTRRIQLPRTGATPSAYTTGLNLYFDPKAGGASDTTPGTATGVSYVLVQGPGLPAGGQILRPGPSGCDQYFVVAASPPPAPLPDTQPCTSHLNIASKAVDGSSSDPNADRFGSAPDFAAAPVSDTDIISGIQPMSAYTFEVHRINGTVLTFVERLVGRPATLQEMGSVRWNVLSDATQAAMVPGTSQSFGGGNFVVTWVPQPDTPPVGWTSVHMRTSSSSALAYDRRDVAFSANTATLTNRGIGFPAATDSAGSYQIVNLVSRTSAGMQIFSSWKY